MFNLSKPVLLFASLGVISACGAHLIWQSQYENYSPKTVTALSTDSENNTYVGAGVRKSDDLGSSTAFNGILLKYNTMGAIQWETPAFMEGTILAVEPMSSTMLAVAVGTPGGGNAVDSLWLVSALNGQIIRKITDISAETGPVFFRGMKTIGQHLYLISGKNSLLCNTALSATRCEYENLRDTIDVFDEQGIHIKQRTTENAEIVDISGLNEAKVAIATYGKKSELQYWNDDLQTIWTSQSDANASAALAECLPRKVLASQQAAHVLCSGGVVKFSWAGEWAFSTVFDAFLQEQPSFSQFWSSDDGYITLDAADDVLVTVPRNTLYYKGTKFGDFELGNVSTLKSDIVTLKLDGDSGRILWSGDIAVPPVAEASHLKVFSSAPLGINAVGDRVFVTYRGLTALYDSCNEISDWELYSYNACSLDKISDHFGKTVVYRSNDGKRVANQLHAMPYLRKVAWDNAGQLVVSGDEETGYMDNFQEILAYGWNFDADSSKLRPADRSDLITQKFKF